MLALSIGWAALRPLQVRASDAALDVDRQSWLKWKVCLVREFVDKKLACELPNLRLVNANTLAGLDALYEKQFPQYAKRSRRQTTSGGRGRWREVLHPQRLGIDSHVITAAFGWLDIESARTVEERSKWLGLAGAFLDVLLDHVPVVKDPRKQEIDGLPTDFDSWVYGIVAHTIPHLTVAEHPESLWQSILDRGSPAHQWVERFFWYWFTNGLRSAKSPPDFVRIWRAMILHALENPLWDPSTSSRHELDATVFELLGFDSRWGALAQNEEYSVAIGTMSDVFDKVAQRWFGMPKVVNGFLAFAVQPGAVWLLLPGVHWVAVAVKSFDTYDWGSGLEENLVEFLHVCWQRDSQRISIDAALREAFLVLTNDPSVSWRACGDRASGSRRRICWRLVQRFENSNPIKQPHRVCRTQCGRRGVG